MKTAHNHIDAQRMQLLLDGALPPAEAAEVRDEIASCVRCAAEFEAWDVLFADLGDLPVLTPSPTFGERVLESLPEAGGARVWLGGRAGARAAATHIDSGALQDYLDGRLAARQEVRVDRHLGSCAICRDELAGYRAVARAVESLPSLAPSTDFTERVMAELRIREMAAMAMAPTSRTGVLLSRVRAAIPSSRQGWAAALGVSVAPVVTLVLLVQSVFAHELVTFGSLFSFLRLQTSGWVDAAVARASTMAADLLPGLVLDGAAWVFGNPTALASAAALGSMGLLVSVWVLYRNLLLTHFPDPDHARLSF